MGSKVDSWYSSLLDVLAEQERQPHVFGETDCIFRVGWASAAQLKEPKRSAIVAMMQRYHSTYASMTGAYRVLRKDGLTPLSLVKSLFEEIPPIEARDGDIGALKQDGRNWLFGTLVKAHLYVPAATGTAILARSQMQKAFRVA